MTLEDIANFCEFKAYTIVLGDSNIGFIQVDGAGVNRNINNYERFLQFNKLRALPFPPTVLKQATLLRIKLGSERQDLSRQEFQTELENFKRKQVTNALPIQ